MLPFNEAWTGSTLHRRPDTLELAATPAAGHIPCFLMAITASLWCSCYLRPEQLSETMSSSVHHARVTQAAWRKDYNTEQPHSRLSRRTPADLTQTSTPQPGLTLRKPQSYAPAPVAQPAQIGKTQTRSLAQTG